MSRWMWTLATVALAGLVLAGCSPLDLLRDRVTAVAPEVEAAPLDAGDEEDPEPDGDPQPAEPTDPDPVEEVTELAPRLAFDVPPITLTTPASGGGDQPLLAWDPVDGADHYVVTLYAGPDAPALWTWRTSATEVVVGVVTDRRGGPRVADGTTWEVTAFDGQRQLIAQSGERPIAP